MRKNDVKNGRCLHVFGRTSLVGVIGNHRDSNSIAKRSHFSDDLWHPTAPAEGAIPCPIPDEMRRNLGGAHDSRQICLPEEPQPDALDRPASEVPRVFRETKSNNPVFQRTIEIAPDAIGY